MEDFVPCPEGSFLGVEGKLGVQIFKISYQYNRLCVTLTVGGNCPPRTPMGPEPLCLSGKRAEGARRADRSEHTGGLPRFGPRWTRKTLLLLSLYWVGELRSLKN